MALFVNEDNMKERLGLLDPENHMWILYITMDPTLRFLMSKNASPVDKSIEDY